MASPSPQQYPFYFAWAYATETTFGSEHEVVDEDIFSFNIKHEEGQIPTLDLTIKNPRIGLLNAGRKVWAWLSYGPPSGAVVPLFFGELVGIPTNIFSELVTLKFHARPTDYIEQKQKVAETMKVSPYYDDIFIERSKRDDPDAVLEGWSSLYHVDRTSLAVTASDILTGEDGTIDFGTPTTSQAFYSSLELKVGEAPLTNVRVEANVRWTQRYDGLLKWDTVNIASYTGDGFMSSWPKAGAELGSGWKTETSYINDKYLVALTPSFSISYSWSATSNGDMAFSNCDTNSVSSSASGPVVMSPDPITCTLLTHGVNGECNPYSDPPINRAAHSEASGIVIPQWFLAADMTLRYDAKRTFSEELTFNVLANTQGVLTSPLVAQHTEVIKISGADVGEPLEEPFAWSDFAGKSVAIGDLIFPNDPKTPGGLSWQICVVSGTAGTVEPTFSDLPGTVTVDGTVQWASLGEQPLSNTPHWTGASPVPEGEIICFIPQYQEILFNKAAGVFEPSLDEAAYYICTTSGTTNSAFSEFTYTPPPESNDQFGMLPVRVQYIRDPPYSETPGALIGDGSVVWTSLGTSPAAYKIPLGGTPLRMGARCYFPTDRGQQSVQFLICKARARIRKRARCVAVGWRAPFEDCLTLSCRKNALIQDPRLPGGQAQGKITSYELEMNNGKWFGQIEIGCSVGYIPYTGPVTLAPSIGKTVLGAAAVTTGGAVSAVGGVTTTVGGVTTTVGGVTTITGGVTVSGTTTYTGGVTTITGGTTTTSGGVTTNTGGATTHTGGVTTVPGAGSSAPGTVTGVPGVGVYANSGYMQSGYQQTTGSTVPIP